MSEMERRKTRLVPVKDSCGRFVGIDTEHTIRDYLESEYSLYIKGDDEVSPKDCLGVLRHYYDNEFNETCPYFILDNKLYKIVEEQELDVYGHYEAEYVGYNGEVKVDCHWYKGGGSFQEVVEEALKRLERDK